MITFGVFPVNDLDSFGIFSSTGFDLHTIAEQTINRFIIVVEVAVGVVGGNAKFVEGFGDLGGVVALFGEIVGEVAIFDVAIVGAILPIAEVVVAKFVPEEGNDAVLGGSFGLSDITHKSSSVMYRLIQLLVQLLLIDAEVLLC
jgi:multisubunit Na+/H+ antiporter MnhF subunit